MTKITEIFALTNEVIEREATPKELAQIEADNQARAERLAKEEAEIAEAEAKRQVAIAKLAALGLEEDDFKALGL
jgi:hypothetical protein